VWNTGWEVTLAATFDAAINFECSSKVTLYGPFCHEKLRGELKHLHIFKVGASFFVKFKKIL
jgi:hypothetical protein